MGRGTGKERGGEGRVGRGREEEKKKGRRKRSKYRLYVGEF